MVDSASAVIGPAGGTVTTPGGASVMVPAGSVSNDTTFTVAESTSTIPADIGQAVGPVYRFGPSGITFTPPVIMVLPFSESQLPQGVDKFRDLVIFTAPNGSSSYTSLGRAQVNGTTASAQTTHFSECVVGVVGCPAPCSRDSSGTCVCPSLDGGGTTGDGGGTTDDGGGTGDGGETTGDGGGTTGDGGGTTGDGGAACNIASSCTPSGAETCLEFPFANPDVESSCTGEGGSYSTSPCSRTDAVGGCRQGSGVGCTTTWYYTAAGLTVEDIQSTCSAGAGVFVTP